MNSYKTDKYVIFEVGNEMYAINILYIDRIVKNQYIRHVPNTKDFVKGIINVKGKDSALSDKGIKDIAPVIDLRMKFGMHTEDNEDVPYIIISKINDIIVGLVVDNVVDVIDIDESELSGRIDDTISVGTTDYIQNFYRFTKENTDEEELYIIVDINKLLELETVEELRKFSE